MRDFHSISITLKAPLSQETLLAILQQGAVLEFNYTASVEDDSIITSRQAAANIMYQITEEKKALGSQDVFIVGQDFPLAFSIYVIENTSPKFNINTIDISLIPDRGSMWYKDKDERYLDFERYIHLLLKLRRDFEPLWLTTSKEYFEEDFYYHYRGLECLFKENTDISLRPNFKVEVTLLPDWKTQTFKNIFMHACSTGWKFYQSVEHLNTGSSLLSADTIIEYILQQSPEGFPEVSLCCVINETHYQLSFKTRPGKYFMLTLTPLGPTIDFAATVRHALDLCTDVCILELNTFDARYNYYEARPPLIPPHP